MVAVFVVLVSALVSVSVFTGARPRTAREWALAWLLLIFLAWALGGFGWLRST